MSPSPLSSGVLLISLALCADAVIGNVQEKALKQYSASNLEMVLFSYFIGFWYLLALVTLSGALIPAFSFCIEVGSADKVPRGKHALAVVSCDLIQTVC